MRTSLLVLRPGSRRLPELQLRLPQESGGDEHPAPGPDTYQEQAKGSKTRLKILEKLEGVSNTDVGALFLA